MTAHSCDVIVIGAGPAGEVLAGRLAEQGRQVTIIESELVGGDCSFYACMPSKALLYPAQALAEARRVPGAAQAATGELDVASVLARRDEVIHDLDDSAQLPWLESRGITLLRGHARLEGERRVRVNEELLVARDALVIAVGSAAAMPPIPGLAQAQPWTNREVTTGRTIPERLIVLGGGAVGVEMAQAYTSLGSHVILIEGQERLLGQEEPFAGLELADALTAAGAELRVGVRPERVKRKGGLVHVELSDGGSVEGEEILVALGRRPRTEDLGLETVGLAPGEIVAVDDELRVAGSRWLYAIGDVNGQALLTHMGKHQAHQLSEIITGHQRRPTRGAAPVSRVVFTEPQVASVGLTLAAALQRGVRARAYDVPSSATAGASFHGRGTSGTSRIVVDEDLGTLVGATFTGTEVAEWLHAATIAIVSGITVDDLWDAVPAFPTRSEIWLKLLEAREAELAAQPDSTTAAPGAAELPRRAQRATLAAGCFWGVEEVLRELDGVLRTTVGYTGGHSPDPTYEQVCGHATGHAEAVGVWFDPGVVSYDQLLRTFWQVHDPTTPKRQGWDVGDQYRSAIFVHDADQALRAAASRDHEQVALTKPIVTEITPAGPFHVAEDYHQHYFERLGPGACAVTIP